MAQDPLAAAGDSGDTAWVMAAAALVLAGALPGLGLLYGGRVKARNFLSVLMQLGAVACVASLAWIIAGYTLAFGNPVNGFIGDGSRWMMVYLDAMRVGTFIPESAFALFQMALAIMAAALMVGAWIGRARFGWAIAFAMLWVLAVYAPVAHWTWGGGWLAAAGLMDFAGGLPIHVTAGVSAVVVALLIGRRKLAGDTASPSQSPELAMVGATLLWVGWFGLVGGNALSATDDASTAIINAQAAASAGALAWLLSARLGGGKPTAAMVGGGAMAGLVSISPAAVFVSPGAAIVIGLAGAIAVRWAAMALKHRWKVDDAMDVFALHAVGGAVGLLLTGVFASPYLGGTGFVQDGMAILTQVSVQAFGIAAVAVYAAIATALIAVAVNLVIPMRVSAEEEAAGLDVASHGEAG
ncbi:ammonium transporter [Paraurantiacibacter namhicola]|nr:ammonium transporter [Paraurantiacibacter namhicola]